MYWISGLLHRRKTVGEKSENNRHQRKDAKRAEKMQKEPFFMKRNRLCYTD